MGGSHLEVDLVVQQILREKEAVGGSTLYLCVVVYFFIGIILISFAGFYASTISGSVKE